MIAAMLTARYATMFQVRRVSKHRHSVLIITVANGSKTWRK